MARHARGGRDCCRRCTVQINYPMHLFAVLDVQAARNYKRFFFIDRSIRLPCNALCSNCFANFPPISQLPIDCQFGSLVLQFSSSTINANRFHLQTLFVQHFRENLLINYAHGIFLATFLPPPTCLLLLLLLPLLLLLLLQSLFAFGFGMLNIENHV